MSNRYNIVKEKSYENYIFENHPVRVEVARILKDEITGHKLVQYKLKNISDDEIDNVTIKVVGYDISNTVLEIIDNFSLADVNAKPKSFFGGENPIVIEDSRVAGVKIIIKSVVLKSGKEWINAEDFSGVEIEVQRETISYTPSQKRELDTIGLKYKFVTKNMFKEYENYWVCSCGKLNSINDSKCYDCDADIEVLREYFDEKYLQELVDERSNNEKAKKEKQKKMGKLVIISGIIICFLLIAYLIVYTIVTNSALEAAQNQFSNKEYEKAISTLDNAFFKNDRINEAKAKYINAYGTMKIEEFITTGDYAQALAIVDKGEVGNTSKGYFLVGNAYFDAGQYKSAYDVYCKCEAKEGLNEEELLIYENRDIDKIVDSSLEYDEWLECIAEDFLKARAYAEALTIYTSINDSYYMELCNIGMLPNKTKRKEYLMYECDILLLKNKDFVDKVKDLFDVGLELFNNSPSGVSSANGSAYIGYNVYHDYNVNNSSIRDANLEDFANKYFKYIKKKFGVSRDSMTVQEHVKEDGNNIYKNTFYSFAYKNRTISLVLDSIDVEDWFSGDMKYEYGLRIEIR